MKKTAVTAVVFLLAMALLLALSPVGISATESDPVATIGNGLIQFGDPAYPATAPESLMRFEAASGANTYNAVYTGTDSATFYPDALAIYFNESISYLNATGVNFMAYAEDGTESTLETPINNPDQFYVIKIGANGGSLTATLGGTSYNINFAAPKCGVLSADAMVINGYLPGVSQYASGKTYGCITKDGKTNSISDQSVLKTIGANAGNIVSLGSSGYIQYELGTPIQDEDTNPYGIDFIVYGNAFVGNPEAAMVEVAADADNNGVPDAWYRLAGSRHYEADTIMNTNLTYTNGVPATDDSESIPITVAASGSSFTYSFSNLNWWPLFSPKANGGENYGDTSGVNTAKVTGVAYNDNAITYFNRTVVADDSTLANWTQATGTDFYAFGYADVRPNGSNIGTATNPYATAPSAGATTGYNNTANCGGDGFDLAWMVDADGKPVAVPASGIKFVRIYSATVFNAGVFGETSAEIARIADVSAKADSAVGVTTTPTIKYSTSGTVPTMIASVANGGSIENTVSAGTHYISVTQADTDNIFINNSKVASGDSYSFTVEQGKTTYIRVITQDGDKEPYLAVIGFKCN